MSPTIIAIESSCDDTSAAVIKDGKILANIVASQAVHEKYGGVVPEIASRMHIEEIYGLADQALENAGVILVCGSPLSGKTHVIYSLLLEIANKNKNHHKLDCCHKLSS